jgi:hypothetical protein
MQNDSIETLVLRHYGNAAPTPDGLEGTLLASVRHEAQELEQRSLRAASWRERPISRRRVLRLVAFGSASLGVVGIGLESLRRVEASLLGQDANKPAYSS